MIFCQFRRADRHKEIIFLLKKSFAKVPVKENAVGSLMIVDKSMIFFYFNNCNSQKKALPLQFYSKE